MSTHPAVNALFLDIGGVLLTNGWDRTMRKNGADQFGLDYKEMDERHHLSFAVYEEGNLSLDEYLDQVVFHELRTFTREQFKEFMFAQSQPYPDMIELVRAVKTRYGLKTVAVSNEARELNDHRIRAFRLTSIIDFFISSSYVHCRKPNPAMYRLALNTAQVGPGEVVYIDDRLPFVETARGFGIHSIHHTSCATTRDSLAELQLYVDDQEMRKAAA